MILSARLSTNDSTLASQVRRHGHRLHDSQRTFPSLLNFNQRHFFGRISVSGPSATASSVCLLSRGPPNFSDIVLSGASGSVFYFLFSTFTTVSTAPSP